MIWRTLVHTSRAADSGDRLVAEAKATTEQARQTALYAEEAAEQLQS